MDRLSSLGFGPFFERQLPSSGGPGAIPARVAAEHRGAWEVWSQAGSGRAQLAGRLRAELAADGLPGVGDWVVVKEAPGPDCTAVIEGILERRTVFTRGAAGRESRAQVIAANVDLVFAVCGLDADFNLRRIERYLARIWASGAQPAVVLNKADVCDDVAGRVAEVERHCPGAPVHVTSAVLAHGVAALRATIRDGMTAALVGSSGAGKSTLVNALLGEDRMATGAVRARDGRGRHVTTHRQLVLLPGGGLLLDTPGMRELQLVDDDGLGSVFGDVAALAARCRYRDCRHDSEPGCAVKEAVAAGELDPTRLDHFRKLEREARAWELRQDEHKRRQAERVWGRLYDEVALLRRWKGGKQ
ncbi:MAG TPA: ribosome small subunit-dependent GTPase A [Thermoanaerobaculales bacterium]|nr:ribosome small subunit-dependent GTPase A [Thermoanaerobaculales bacterium]HPA80473.1 ribosome small subunit-dependent GTPase A [Thermoanaerobaculales bacterium]HQL29844.1 ribosome small subunit-dependent GTPase A [Thermoanaerobaculales bacterium]HQN96802.1 ribosome small subunit-dependent GTPase A [Thermoanaerobaculales bacterium]